MHYCSSEAENGIGNFCYLYMLAYTNAKRATMTVAVAATPGKVSTGHEDGRTSSIVTESVVVTGDWSCVDESETDTCFLVLIFLGAMVVLGASSTVG